MYLTLKDALLNWKSQSGYNGPGEFVFPTHRYKGKKPLDLAAILRRKIQPAFVKVGITRVGYRLACLCDADCRYRQQETRNYC